MRSIRNEQSVGAKKLGSGPLVFMPDGLSMVSVFGDTPLLWTIEDGVIQLEFNADDYVSSLATSPDGQILAAGTNLDYPKDRVSIYLWRVSDGKELHKLEFDGIYISHLGFSPDGRMLLSTGPQSINLWDVEQGIRLREWPGNSGFFSLDGRLIGIVQEGVLTWWGIRP